MEESILVSIKKLLGITEDCKEFDQDIIIDINSALGILTQIGIGPSDGIFIIDSSTTWSDIIPSGMKLEMIKSYIHLKVKLLFDTSTLTSATIEAMNKMLSELEWRIYVSVN